MNQVAGTLPSSGQMLLAWKIINRTVCIQGDGTISVRLSSPEGSACGEGSVVTELTPPSQANSSRAVREPQPSFILVS